jgi:hypothetical protein
MKPVLMIALAMGAAQAASKHKPAAEFEVHIYVKTETYVHGPTMADARFYATHLLSDAGVRLEWHGGVPLEGDTRRNILLRFVKTAPANVLTSVSGKALACAQPYANNGTVIMIFTDRMTGYLSRFESRREVVLGHVLAHEICHVLEGIARHSEDGLMKGAWTYGDERVMLGSFLKLAEVDRTLIREALKVAR